MGNKPLSSSPVREGTRVQSLKTGQFGTIELMYICDEGRASIRIEWDDGSVAMGYQDYLKDIVVSESISV